MIEKVLIISLATYYLTTIITQYDGMYKIFARMRDKFHVLTCYGCTSVYVSLSITWLLVDTLPLILSLALGSCGLSLLIKEAENSILN